MVFLFEWKPVTVKIMLALITVITSHVSKNTKTKFDTDCNIIIIITLHNNINRKHYTNIILTNKIESHFLSA